MSKTVTVLLHDVRRLMVECLVAAGAELHPAKQQAHLLLTADSIGYRNHGLNKLERYVDDITNGVCLPNNKPKILKETASTGWVEANNVLGATASYFGMDLAMKKATETGVGWVTVRGSNHHGISGHWARYAADKGFIGIACSNASPIMAPTRSKKAAIGPNTIAVVAHGSEGERFYMDLATSAVSLGKIETAVRNNEPIPAGWAQGPDGKVTTDSQLAVKTKCLMPLGGSEATGGYKGYALSVMVEILCGILSDGTYGPNIRTWSIKERIQKPANLSHCFIAVDPGSFAPGLGDRILDSIRHWRKLEPIDQAKPVMAPGDLERKTGKVTRDKHIITYPESLYDSANKLAERLKVKPITKLRPK